MIDPDEVRLSAAIQHTPQRDDDPVYLALIADLKRCGVDPQVVVDPEPEAAYTSTWRTYEEALRRAPWDCTHHLILQDDVQICDGFVAGVAAAIRSRPDYLLSFFISHRPYRSVISHLRACESGEAWSALDAQEWVPTQALCWPVWLVAPMLRHARDHPIQGPHNADDQRVGAFIRARGLLALQSCPSLVEHVHAESTTLDPGLNRVGADRRARCWLAPGRGLDPARDVQWRSGVY